MLPNYTLLWENNISIRKQMKKKMVKKTSPWGYFPKFLVL